MKNIYDQIKDVALRNGFTLVALADKMKISRQSLNASMKSPSYPTLQKIAEVLHVPMWQLFASPEEVASQEFIAFFYHKGRTHTPSTMKEILDVLEAWNSAEFKKECHNRDFLDLCDKYSDKAPVKNLIDSLCALLAEMGHPGAVRICQNTED